MAEQINPDHYKKSIETYDAIVSQLSPAEVVGFLRSQVLKYVMRFGAKHESTVQACLMDISKADWYLDKLGHHLEELDNPQSYTPEYVSKPNVTNLFNKDS
tara:strand:- start:697 stop:999 length:303 start_codon:yes stop_codon:yes gene_type:complete